MKRTLWILIGLFLSCCGGKEGASVSLVEESGKVIGIDVPVALVADADHSELVVTRKDSDTPLLGRWQSGPIGPRFIAHVPLTRGQTYRVMANHEPIGVLSVPGPTAPAPELVAIYPARDTVPENLLKVYLRFSAPMMEGRSASFVHLVKEGRDTMNGTFLDLQPELWNPEGTVLTLWLDPGRIKLDLIPNKELGNPLSRGATYSLVVGAGWRSKEGVPLAQAVNKSFYVGARDDRSPEIKMWAVTEPDAGTTDPLVVDFNESLDRLLVEEAIGITDEKQVRVGGSIRIVHNDSRLEFIPDFPWKPGTYLISVESRLEDLAGNNMNRLFETDLSKAVRKESRPFYERAFVIKPDR